MARWVGVLLLVLVAGCGSDPPVPSSVAYPVPDGFVRVGGRPNGLMVSIPQSWRAVDLTQADYVARLEQSTGLSGAALVKARESLTALAPNKAVYAVDPASQSAAIATNLNAFCQPSVGGSLDQLTEVARQQLVAANATVTETGRFPVGPVQGVRIRYTLAPSLHGVQYYAPSDKGRTCVLTLTTAAPGQDALFEKIGTTLRPL